MRLTVALAGEEAAGLQTLRLITGRDHHVAMVLSDSVGAGQGATVTTVAADLDIPVRPAADVRDPRLADELSEAGVDLLLNVHSLHIVDARVLDAPALGSYNLHPGPLPERAGLNAPSWGLYLGADHHGVTVHRMTPGVDEGPIAFAERFTAGPRDTALMVATECVRRGLPLLERLLETLERGAPVASTEQDLARRRWFGAGPPDGGRLNWERPAVQVADFVRACDYGPFSSPWGFPRCAAENGEVAITAAEPLQRLTEGPPGTVLTGERDAVHVGASDHLVRVDRVELGGERLPASQVLRPGERLRAIRDPDRVGSR